MIRRVVKLTIKEDKVEEFFEIFRTSQKHILAREGCHEVYAYQDIKDPRHCFTISLWEDQASLDLYRKSELFGRVWPKTKLLFDGKPEAWSMRLID